MILEARFMSHCNSLIGVGSSACFIHTFDSRKMHFYELVSIHYVSLGKKDPLQGPWLVY